MSSQKQRLVPGIMGGMGPEATLDFMTKVLQRTDARADQGHLRLLIDHNPKVPNRHASIDGSGEDVTPYLLEMAANLERSGADFVVMVCNTAHAYQGAIAGSLSIPFVSIIDEVVDELNENTTGKPAVGVMAAEGCLNAQLYQNALRKSAYPVKVWDQQHLEQFMELVYQIKAGETGKQSSATMEHLANELVEQGAEILLAGCTEIPLVLDAERLAVPFYCSTDVLVSRVIDYALGVRDIGEP
ncbi:MAG: amino acid racemase [Proteobacteria bacterium]|jgi:aspartate racemase|nr:amino acid racemase [Pseudomonadota bacterium]